MNHILMSCVSNLLWGGVGRNNNFERQKEMMGSIYNSLKKDGVLLFAENLKATMIHQVLRKTFAKKNWRYISLEEALQLAGPFSETSYKTFGFLGVLGRNQWLNNALSAIDNLFDRCLKEQYKYIISCVCRK